MKYNILSLFLLLGSTLMGQSLKVDINAIPQSDDKFVLEVNVDAQSLNLLDWQSGNNIDPLLDEGTPILKLGAPQLYQLSENIALKGSQSADIKIISTAWQDIQDVDILPSKGNIYRDVDPNQVALVYGSVYEDDAFYPSSIASTDAPYIIRGVHGQVLHINPIQYNPLTKVLRIHTSFRVELTDKQEQAESRTLSKGMVEIMEKRFLNFHLNASRYDQLSEIGEMLVISAPEYLSEVQELVDWKIQRGIRTSLVDINAIGTDPAAIYQYIADFYAAHDLTYVLLVGDENNVPTMQTEFDNACDHCYAYLDGDDHYADIFIGRFNGENVEHIRTMVARTLEYEKTPNTTVDWMSKAIGLGSNEGPGDDGEYDYEHLNNIKMQLLDYGFTDVYECYQGSNAGASPTPNSPTADLNGGPTVQSLIDHINNGVTMLNYTGHGGHTALSTGNFDIQAVNELENNGRYPFVIAVACCVGDFQNDFGAGPCLGDAWIRATEADSNMPSGGIGGLFSSILQSWAPPMEGQDEMGLILTENAQYSTRHTIGGVSLHGMASMIDAYGGGGEEMADTWNIFGDPSVVLRTKLPGELVLGHSPFIELGASTLSVTCDLEDAMVAASHDGEVMGVGFVENGVLELVLENVDQPMTLTLTGTAYNHIPYQGTVEVTPTGGVYMLANMSYLNDESGNSNQLADYGESVSVDLNFSNVGLADAENLSATVSTSSPFVNMPSPATVSLPDLEQGLNSLVTDAFSFVVLDNIEDGEVAQFLIEINDGDEQWSSTISIPLYAPELELQDGLSMDDASSSIPNGRFDAGETVSVRFTVKNTGSSAIMDVQHLLDLNSDFVEVVQASASTDQLDPGQSLEVSFDLLADAQMPINQWVELSLDSESGAYSDALEDGIWVNLFVEDFEDEEYNAEPLFEGDLPWFKDFGEALSGAHSMRSGAIGDEQTTQMYMILQVEEAGLFSFHAKVSTEDSYDYLFFSVNGEELAEWSGESGWTAFETSIEAGENILTWNYVKDYSVSSGDDAVWVDDIVLPVLEEEVSTLSISSKGKSLKAYPNPTSGLITLDLSDDALVIVEDLLGRTLQRLPLNAGIQDLDLSIYEAGTYIIRNAQDPDQEVIRIVIK